MESKQVVLVDPPWHRLFGSHYNGLPLGICYISSFLNSNGIDTIVYNGDYENTNVYQSQYDRLNSYYTYLKVLDNLDNKIWSNTVNDILNMEPSIVGISVNQVTLRGALNIAHLIKQETKNIKIVLGGPYITINPTIYPDIDGIIVGEGELSMLQYYNSPQSIVRSNRIENLDALPFPDRDNIFRNGKYMEYGHIITGRGCPYNCIFCASKTIWGNSVRLRSIGNVIKELEYIEDRYGCKSFLFRDDTFTITKDRTLDFCSKVNNKGYIWQCDTRIDNLSKDVLSKMKNSGCHGIKIGVESGSERMLTFINKKITKDKVRQVVNDCKELGINITTYFLVGLPTETNEDIQASIDFIEELNPDNVSVSIATPYSGTLLEGTMNIDKNHMEKYFHQSLELLNNLQFNKELTMRLFNISHKKKEGTYGI